jgi:homoserine dehydrogenase
VDVILLEEIEKMVKLAKKEMETTLLGAVPIVDTMRAIFWTKGLLRFRALSTLNLEAILYKMAKENKTLEQAIAEVFQTPQT